MIGTKCYKIFIDKIKINSFTHWPYMVFHLLRIICDITSPNKLNYRILSNKHLGGYLIPDRGGGGWGGGAVI